MADEFFLIEKYFKPLSAQIGDDCALLSLTEGEQLAISVDTMVEGVHFPVAAPSRELAYRCVATALSDLAAMGAAARGITLALTLPQPDEDWLSDFSQGLAQVLADFDVVLLGGDTTRGPLTLTVQVLGEVPAGQALRRSGAAVGDGVYVSGTVGDAAAGLQVLQGKWVGDLSESDGLVARFYRPQPRLALGQLLRGVASSAIDISDGLLADAGHLCTQSSVGIKIDAPCVPLSAALAALPDREAGLQLGLGGGDDYELLFTVPPGLEDRIPAGCTRIGEVIEGAGVSCIEASGDGGYRHFGSGDVAHSSPQPFSSLVQFLAFGFGSGLAPRAPGTAGTLVAIPLYLLFAGSSLAVYSAVCVIAVAIGVWLCGRASKELGIHDHPGIVWDEFAGYWITLWAVPASWHGVLLGFLVFRFFDIAKPWPISWCDRHVHGGFGIMLDDVLAGVISCAVLHAMYLVF
jgi:thiamine-monophosphate kinase